MFWQIELFTQMGFRGGYLLGIPLVMNLLLFYAHFAILINSGPGNSFVSVDFQDTLKVPHLYVCASCVPF